MSNSILEKVNRFTRREFSEEELYIFSVVLCDNDTDRDNESFSESALEQLKELFVGKTGIFDHNTSTSNQNARIFDMEIVTDGERVTKDGKPYRYLKGMAYMVRTDDNKNLIAEIDAGIKKEVSISCAVSRKICSVCGTDRTKKDCRHIKGKTYNGKVCHIILDNVTDAYEWSFVAVPAQVNAGVTKKFSEEVTEKRAGAEMAEVDEEIRRDIRRLAFFRGGRQAAESAEISARNMTTSQLINLKKSYERLTGRHGAEVQLMADGEKENNESYKV